jgi:hypothetical protein
MKIQIELLAGSDHRYPTKRDMGKNIDAQERAIQGKTQAGDYVLLMDTKYILLGIQECLPVDYESGGLE